MEDMTFLSDVSGFKVSISGDFFSLCCSSAAEEKVSFGVRVILAIFDKSLLNTSFSFDGHLQGYGLGGVMCNLRVVDVTGLLCDFAGSLLSSGSLVSSTQVVGIFSDLGDHGIPASVFEDVFLLSRGDIRVGVGGSRLRGIWGIEFKFDFSTTAEIRNINLIQSGNLTSEIPRVSFRYGDAIVYGIQGTCCGSDLQFYNFLTLSDFSFIVSGQLSSLTGLGGIYLRDIDLHGGVVTNFLVEHSGVCVADIYEALTFDKITFDVDELTNVSFSFPLALLLSLPLPHSILGQI
jgi:hypothetical protein